jgi:hypothetical protein
LTTSFCLGLLLFWCHGMLHRWWFERIAIHFCFLGEIEFISIRNCGWIHTVVHFSWKWHFKDYLGSIVSWIDCGAG